MAMPIEKVEVGFDTSFSGAGNFFVLDDATKGQLDNTSYPLGGLTFIDVTDRVRNFSISRGRSNLFSAFPAGQLNVEFNNHDRAFDPLYAQSPFAGNIVPRREIRVSTDDVVQYVGWIDDWGFSYLPNGDSVAEAIAYDATSIISGQTLAAGTPTAQLTGARVSNILDQINWSPEERNIEAGVATLGTAVIDANTNAMNYLQTIALSEPGLVFVDKIGRLTFLDRTQSPTSTGLVQFGGTGIPFQSVDVSYGSDNLYNEVVLDRVGGGTATATDTQSVTDYGLRTLSQSGLLLNTDLALAELALVLAQQYSQPEYRFSSLEVAIHKLDPAEQEDVLGLELGSIAKIVFTPNGIGDAIQRFVQVISINHTVNPQNHFVEFGFQSLDAAYLVLDDAEFGKLDLYSLSW
jgi:hypothetical protein